MKRFLYTNRDYYKVLDELSRFESVPMEIIEFIAANPKDFQNNISEVDSELSYHDGTISGCYRGDFEGAYQ